MAELVAYLKEPAFGAKDPETPDDVAFWDLVNKSLALTAELVQEAYL